MGMIGLKVRDDAYDRLKWLKTRFEFVHEKPFSWDDFFNAITKDSLLIIAQVLQRKGGGSMEMDDILRILSGEQFDAGSVITMYRELGLAQDRQAVRRGDRKSGSDPS